MTRSRTAPVSLPDLTLVVRRNGVVQSWTGGETVPELRRVLDRGGQWSESTRSLIERMVKECIARRSPVEARTSEAGVDYDLRCSPINPGEAACTVRAALTKDTDRTVDETGVGRRPGLERRGFTRLLRDLVARARLRDAPVAVAVIKIDGLEQIAHTIGRRTADRVLDVILRRLGDLQPVRGDALGQIHEDALAYVMGERDRSRVEERLLRIEGVIRQPLDIEGVPFRLSCFSGVALLGLEGATPTHLLDLASAAAEEAKRASSRSPRFHSDSVRVRGLERLDVARELRTAVESHQLAFRLVNRHDLSSGALTARVAYLRWSHPLLGQIAPAEFLAIAECVGYGTSMSRSLFEHLCSRFAVHMGGSSKDVRLSFGPLRDHVMDEHFVADVLRTCEMHGVPLERLELRLAERAFVNVDLGDLTPLTRRGVRLVVDEVGRDWSSLAALARAPIWGLQIDRAWVTDADRKVSSGVCAAVAVLASALGIKAIATGVDTAAQRDRLTNLGYEMGSGDLYPAVQLPRPLL